MSSNFPLCINGVQIWSSEALYQACRYPVHPEIQRLIIAERSPMTAKMKAKHYVGDSRPDWLQVRVRIMRWCLKVKLAQNWARFGSLLLSTEQRTIVEESKRDEFWAAKQTRPGEFVGINALGRLLMELREELRSNNRESLKTVEPPNVREFLLLGLPIGVIKSEEWISPAERSTQGRIENGWNYQL